MARGLKIAGLVLLVLLVVAAAFLGVLAYLAGRSLPADSAALTAAGLKEEVKIVRDDYGIPHIYAKNMNDVFFAQGYCQAQDRLWEMDLSRQAVAGRLSEIFGADLLPADKFFLALGLAEAARQSHPAYNKETMAYLESFAAGVNQYIQEAGDNLPPEFKILGYKPEKWQPLDSIGIGKYMAHTLGGNLTVELLNLNLALKVGEEKLREMLPAYSAGGLTIMKEAWRDKTGEGLTKEPAGDLAGKLPDALDTRVLRSLLALPGEGVGSNNWVVSGGMTASGKPILCNDMHLEIKNPSIWYQNHLVVEGKMNVTGVIFPGAPGVVVGHNGRIAWGVTNVNPDVQDLYLEKRNPQNPRQFEYNGKWEDARVIKYEIPVKKSGPAPFEVVYTRHGPIISDIYPEAKNRDLALRWTAHLPTTELEALIGFDLARNWDEFKAALEKFKVPAQNFVYADVDGNIAYRANGLIPIRKQGNGLLPVPGWTGEYEWAGFIPWNELPQTVNPPEGLIVTANNKVIDNAYPYLITYQWSAPYRAESIRQELEGKRGLTLDEVLRPQSDWKNLQARRLASSLASALRDDAGLSEQEKKARDILCRWAANNPCDNPGEAAPAIFHLLYLEMVSATFRDELGDDLFNFLLEGRNTSILNNNFDAALEKKQSLWFDDVTTPQKETADDIIRESLKKTVARLQKELGGDPADWQWGKLHTVTIDHPLGASAVLRPVFNDGPYPIGGSEVTAGAASYEYRDPFAVTSAGPWRYGVDLAGMQGKDILAGGASGHPRSRHYKDQTPLWLKGQYKELLFDDQKIQAGNKNVTLLKPSPGI